MTDRDLLDIIVSDGLLDAWIDILSKYTNKWIKGDEITCPESFQNATDEIIQQWMSVFSNRRVRCKSEN